MEVTSYNPVPRPYPSRLQHLVLGGIDALLAAQLAHHYALARESTNKKVSNILVLSVIFLFILLRYLFYFISDVRMV